MFGWMKKKMGNVPGKDLQTLFNVCYSELTHILSSHVLFLESSLQCIF
jgi:hypothetical protein